MHYVLTAMTQKPCHYQNIYRRFGRYAIIDPVCPEGRQMVFGHLPFHFRENDTVAFLFFLFQVKERAAAAGVTIRCNSVD